MNRFFWIISKKIGRCSSSEVKSSNNQHISKTLIHFQKVTGAKHAFQVTFDLDYIEGNCFAKGEPTIVPVTTFLSQLL